jgi:serine/threonine-protein kinase RsbW
MDTEVLREAFDLAARASSVAEARHRTLAWLFRYPVGQQAAESAVLIVSELVTNAIVHSGSDIVRCVLRLGSGLLRIEVTDQGVGVAEPAVRMPADDDVSGRGLLLVSAVSEEWGVSPAVPGGRTVWATVRADA